MDNANFIGTIVFGVIVYGLIVGTYGGFVERDGNKGQYIIIIALILAVLNAMGQRNAATWCN